MKKILGSLVVIGLAMNVIGCASNTQGENTAIGAVSGGVVGGVAGAAITHGNPVGIGVGIVAGALVGGAVGNSMEASDKNHVVYSVKSGHSVTWVNPHTHTKYTMTPVGKYMTIHGNRCRKFVTTAVTTSGKVMKSKGIICRQANGTWSSM